MKLKNLQALGVWTLLMAAATFSLSVQAETKIAVMDFQGVLLATDAAKTLRQKIEKELKPTQDKAAAIQTELEGLQKKLEKDGAIMSKEEKRKLSEKGQAKQMELRTSMAKAQQRKQELEQNFLRESGPIAEKVAKKLIEEKGFDIVFHAGAVAHATPKYDLSKELLERLNKALK